MSEFIKAALRKELERLYGELALHRGMLRDSRTCWWEPTKYWQDAKVKTIREGKEKIAKDEREIAALIRDHKEMMGEEWSNVQRRLCWDKFTGGLPIGIHYCNRPEGHTDHHGDDQGLWHQHEKHRSPKPPKRIPARREWERKKSLPLP